jgi:hypothetical protein
MGDMNWIELAHNKVLVNTVMNLQIPLQQVKVKKVKLSL